MGGAKRGTECRGGGDILESGRCPGLVTYYNYQGAQLFLSWWEWPGEGYDREKKIREVRVEWT